MTLVCQTNWRSLRMFNVRICSKMTPETWHTLWKHFSYHWGHGEINQPNYSPEFLSFTYKWLAHVAACLPLHFQSHPHFLSFFAAFLSRWRNSVRKVDSRPASIQIAVCTIHVHKSIGEIFFSWDTNSSLWTLVTAGNRKPHGSLVKRKYFLAKTSGTFSGRHIYFWLLTGNKKQNKTETTMSAELTNGKWTIVSWREPSYEIHRMNLMHTSPVWISLKEGRLL